MHNIYQLIFFVKSQTITIAEYILFKPRMVSIRRAGPALSLFFTKNCHNGACANICIGLMVLDIHYPVSRLNRNGPELNTSSMSK